MLDHLSLEQLETLSNFFGLLGMVGAGVGGLSALVVVIMAVCVTKNIRDIWLFSGLIILNAFVLFVCVCAISTIS